MSVTMATYEDLVEVKNAISRIEALIFVMADKNSLPQVISIKDIASLEGCSESQLRNGKMQYLLPRFGQSAYPNGRARWPIKEYLDWSAIDPARRLEMYHAHLEQIRKNHAKNLTAASQ